MIRISNGIVIDPASQLDGEYDVILHNKKIIDIVPRGQGADGQFEREIDAKGCWVIPGLIDLHVHLREPGQEWKETVRTGALAALKGGFTSICCMPNTQPAIDCEEVVRYVLDKARDARYSRVLPIGAITKQRAGKEMAPLSELREAGCVAFSDDGDPVYNAGIMRRALEWAKMLGVPLSCHEEDKDISCGGCMNESPLSTRLGLTGMPKVAEDVMVARDIELARDTDSQVHFCHVSTSRSVELIRRAKNDGIRVTAEVTPHHLVLNEEAVRDYDTYAKMSPPLREEYERELLIEGVKDGTLDAIASDHAPHEEDVKQIEFSEAAMGILGLQTSLPLLVSFVDDQILSRTRAISSLTDAPARAFGLPYGSLRKHSPADVVILDPDAEWVFSREDVVSKSFNSPFYGRKLKGKVRDVFVDGEIRLQDGCVVE
ncbi:MAG: dihydroorotase [Bdellovibrionales bacterium]|nr:dihydroorotase [Bdellovibrionales bacterium]